MLVAPSEPKPLQALGLVTSQAERKGADFLWAALPVGLVGVQRKQFPGDFIASVGDGRLEKELGQMRALDVAVLLLEGRGTWTTDGELIHSYGQRWTRSGHRKFLCSVQAQGVWVLTTENLDDTVRALHDLVDWSRKPAHNATRSRPAARRDGWGRITDRTYAIHLLQGLPDVGPELATRLYDHFGRCPLRLTVTEQELRGVHGIGKKYAAQLARIFGGDLSSELSGELR